MGLALVLASLVRTLVAWLTWSWRRFRRESRGVAWTLGALVSIAHGCVAGQTAPVSNYISKAAPTPAVDAERLYAFFESGDVVTLDHDGNDAWSRSLVQDYGPSEARHGIGSSLALTRESLWKRRLGDSCWASPVRAGDRVYFFTQGGTTVIIRAGAKWEELARNTVEVAPGSKVYGIAAVSGASYSVREAASPALPRVEAGSGQYLSRTHPILRKARSLGGAIAGLLASYFPVRSLLTVPVEIGQWPQLLRSNRKGGAFARLEGFNNSCSGGRIVS